MNKNLDIIHTEEKSATPKIYKIDDLVTVRLGDTELQGQITNTFENRYLKLVLVSFGENTEAMWLQPHEVNRRESNVEN